MKPIKVVFLKPFLKAAKTIGLQEEDIARLETEVAYAPEEGGDNRRNRWDTKTTGHSS
jgi:hypothetical protein